jgi:outer membrane autotransporter protein
MGGLSRGLSLANSDKQGTLLGTISSLGQPLEQGGGASADSSTLPSRFGVFANGLGSFGDQDTTPREPGFDFHTAGFTVGGDYRFTNRLSLGMAFSYVQTNADFDSSAGNFSNKAYSLSAYGTYYILEKLYVDGIVTYGWDNYTTERNIPGTGTANGSPSGTHLAPSLSAGYNFNVGALTFGPTGRLEYVRVDIDAYREHGADPFNLSIRSQNVESLTTAFGGQATYAISTPWGVFSPLARFEWVHEYEGNSRQVIGSFTTTPTTSPTLFVSDIVYGVQTGNPDRDYFRLGGGLSATLQAGISAFLYYEAVLGRTNFTDNTFHAGVRFEF